MTILIAALGNRNLLLDGKEISKDDFRTTTREIYEALKDEPENIENRLSLNIIPAVIENNEEKVYLMATDQKDDHFKKQDTLFEAEIVKHILEKHYHLPTNILTYEGNPTVEEEVYEKIPELLRKIFRENPDAKIYRYNDAGGTPQVKAVIKDLLEFYLPAEKREVKYVTPDGNKIDITAGVYQQKYTLLRAARQFVNEYEYASAKKVLLEIPDRTLSGDLSLWLEFAESLRDMNHENLKEIIKNPVAQKPLKKFIEPFKQYHTPDTFCSFLNKDSLPNDRVFGFYTIASKCDAYLRKEDYTLFTALYYRLCEEFAELCIKLLWPEFKLDNKAERNNFAQWICDQYSHKYPNLKPQYGTIILLIALMESENTSINHIASLFYSDMAFSENKEGINTLRNKTYLAHKNKGVTRQGIEKINPQFFNHTYPEIFKALGMPEENMFDRINRKIEEVMLSQ